MAEKLTGVVQDMFESWMTVVRCAVSGTEEFKVEVKQTALSSFLFALVIYRLDK